LRENTIFMYKRYRVGTSADFSWCVIINIKRWRGGRHPTSMTGTTSRAKRFSSWSWGEPRHLTADREKKRTFVRRLCIGDNVNGVDRNNFTKIRGRVDEIWKAYTVSESCSTLATVFGITRFSVFETTTKWERMPVVPTVLRTRFRQSVIHLSVRFRFVQLTLFDNGPAITFGTVLR